MSGGRGRLPSHLVTHFHAGSHGESLGMFPGADHARTERYLAGKRDPTRGLTACTNPAI